MRLFIADDNIPFRTRLASIISNIEGIDVVGVAGDVPETIKAIKQTQLDTIILDFHMPGGNGFDVLRAVKSSRPSPTVIMLTVGPRSEYQALSFLYGADYFFEKSSDLRKMMQLLENSVKEPKIHTSKTK
jgi:DNA-binding NarL/FixJ family response regulator